MVPWVAGLMASGLMAVAPINSAELSAPPLVDAVLPDKPVAKDKMGMIGVMLDVGVPDGAAASAIIRPLPYLRFTIGGMTNGVSGGIRAGVAFVPFNFWISPSLTVEGGHYFDGNANTLVEKIAGNASYPTAFLDHFSYDFANAHVGIELGSQRRFSFFIHGGMSHLELAVPGFGAGLNQATGSNSITAQTPVIRVNTVSAKLGFVLFFG